MVPLLLAFARAAVTNAGDYDVFSHSSGGQKAETNESARLGFLQVAVSSLCFQMLFPPYVSVP